MKDNDQSTEAPAMQADAIFFDALGVEDEAGQKAFVEEACAGNEALHRKVDSMLTSLTEIGDFLEDDSALWISAKDLYEVLSDFPKA